MCKEMIIKKKEKVTVLLNHKKEEDVSEEIEDA